MSLSEKIARISMQRLFDNREKDNLADFIIESKDGTQFKVHSLILHSRGSDFFETMLRSDSNFNEKKEGKVEIPEASTETVTQFVRILYGLDLDENVSLDVIKELIMIGGVYDASVQEVAGEHVKKHLNKKNVFEMLKFCKEREARMAVMICLQMIVNNFTREELLESRKFDDHPDLAVELIKHEHKSKVQTQSKTASFFRMFDE